MSQTRANALSVIVPTFNRAHTIGRALDSVRAQTRRPDEVIVVDDGSEDGTVELVRRRYPEVTLVHQSNRGVSAARNVGIERSRGAFIAFLDSDDEWLPTKLERQLEELENSPGTMLCHTDEVWIRRGRRVNPMKKHEKSGGLIYRRCLPLCVISPSAVIARPALFDAIGVFDESLPACEDYDLWLRVTARYPVLFVDERLTVKHGGHDDQLSRRYWGMDRFRVRALEKMLASEELTEANREATRAMLTQKLRILSAGARKRGNADWARGFEAQLELVSKESST